MLPNEYKRNFELEEEYWWFAGSRKIFIRLMDKYFSADRGKKILDIGCGTGIMAGYLEKYGRFYGMDYSRLAVNFCKQRGIKNLVVSSGENCCFKNETFDYITALGVIEHIENDKRLLEEIQRMLKPGGLAILSTSAFDFLWSEHDAANRHFRRYTISKLKNLAASSRLSILYESYFNFFLFVPITVVILLKRLAGNKVTSGSDERLLPNVPYFINWMLKSLLILESWIIERFALFVGVSIVIVLKKC